MIKIGDTVIWQNRRNDRGMTRQIGIANCRVLEFVTGEGDIPAAMIKLPPMFGEDHEPVCARLDDLHHE